MVTPTRAKHSRLCHTANQAPSRTQARTPLQRNRSGTIGLMLALALILTGAPRDNLPLTRVAQADKHGSIRFYKLTKKGQVRQKRRLFANRAGCHNPIRRTTIYRVAQFNFAYCEIFSRRNCVDGAQLEAKWDGSSYRTADIDIDEPQTKLLPGDQWHLLPTQKNTKSWRWQTKATAADTTTIQNSRIKSWRCEYE